MKPLYKDQLPEAERAFRKEAAYAGRLSEEPTNWPQEVTSDLFKELPFLSDYDVNVTLDKVDEERGYGFGYADVHNKTERPEVEHDEAGLPHIRIPVVIEERMRKPFSVFLDEEKVMPLNEERIREHLFNPGTFDLSTIPPQDPSLVENLMPPQRSGVGMGGDYKLASADDQLLAMLSGGKKKVAFKHISQEQWQAMYNSLEIQKLVQQYGSSAHPAVQNKVYEMAAKIYGYHPKPEPPPPGKVQEHYAKQQEKQQKDSQKQQDKAQKMLSEGQKLMGGQQKKASVSKTAMFPGAERITPDQWSNIYDTHPKVKALVKKHGRADHPEVDLAVMSEAYRRHGMQKTSSLLLAIAPTIRESDAQRFVEKVASSFALQAGFRRSGIADTLVEALDLTKRASADDHLRAVAGSVAPSVVTIHKLPGGDFLVKSANADAFAPDEAAMGEQVPAEEMAGAMGEDQAQAMQPGQTLTAVSDPVESTEPAEPAAEQITRFGEYLVQDLMGNQVMGWAFPSTLAWDGEFSEQPVALFTNGSAYAVQDAIAGEMIGRSTSLPVSPVRGEGAFYEVTRDGVKVTAPVTVRSGMTGPDGSPMYACQDFMGNEFSVHMAQELAQPQRISDTEYAIPATWKFMALSNQTQLVPDPMQMNKTGAVKQAAQSVTLFWNGSFNLEGGCGLAKLAKDFRYDLSPVDAEFMLGLLGVNGADIKEKLSQARKHGEVKLANLHEITTLAERFEEKQKTAQTLLLRVPDLRRDLMKEAAVMEDEATVDKLLALNFINPENLSTFISYVPELEETSEKLAELLLSSYLGMKEIPESAVERSMKNMEEVVRALKAVEHAEA